MRFSIITLLAFTAFVALMFFSLANSPSRYWSDTVKAIYGLVFASAIVFGYDRRDTPVFAFGVYGSLMAFFFPPATFGFSLVLDRLGLIDRSVMENLAVVETAKHHLAMIVASVAFFLWRHFSICRGKRTNG